ncbi:hypothetical protein TRIUR3_22341 [Triticum urartu]|uniref:Sacsin/Nov domain-containing protein n=1 Tax=Triticum urartu TaxID=4572 RepID=M8AZL0_TRIUA|nr:hypothetical protein TRIUR3_22341 [Triticum urartu]
MDPGGMLLEDFGLWVDLARRIREVLANYPEGTTALRELIQNADDAGASCRASTGRGDEPRRAKLRTPAGAASVQRQGLQRQQHLCVGRNNPWARAGGSSPPPVGGCRAPARHHQRPAAEHQLTSTSGRQQSTTWARAGQEGLLGVGEEERLGKGGGGSGGRGAEAEDAEEENGLIQSLN